MNEQVNPGGSSAPGPQAPTAPDDGGISPLAIPLTIGEPESAPELTPEQQEIATLRQQLEAQGQQTQQLLGAVTQMVQRQQYPQQYPQQQAPQEPAGLPEFSLDGLPDPVSKPTDFTKQLQERIAARDTQLTQHLTNNITQNITGQLSRAHAMDSVYNRFVQQHPDLARYQSMVQGAAAAEFSNLKQYGYDPAMIAQQNPDSLVANIAARMQSELGIQPGQQPAPGQAPTAPAAPYQGQAYPQHGQPLTPLAPPTHHGQPPAAPGMPPGAARTQGIAGGSAPGAPTSPTAPAPPGFTAQLNKQRQADGLI